MAARILVVSPRRRFAEELLRALRQHEKPIRAEAIWQYPTAIELDLLLGPDTDVAAFIVDWDDPDAGSRLVKRVRLTRPEVLCFAALERRDAERGHTASQAGVVELMTPPYDVSSLVRKIEVGADAQPKGRLVCFLPAQGGGGASTIALHVAEALARLGGEGSPGALFVEFDLHSASAAFRLKLNSPFTVSDALKALAEKKDPWARLVAPRPGLFMLPAPPAETPIDPAALSEGVDLLEAARNRFAWVVVDLPSALYASCRDALSLAEAAYIVAGPEASARKLMGRRVDDLAEMGFRGRELKLILNRAGEPVEESLPVGAELTAVIPNAWNAVNDAYTLGRLVEPNTPFGRAIHLLAKKMIGS